MNPYDFVPLDLSQPPERRKPVWHNALTPDAAHPGKLYSGYLYLDIKAETPLFIRDADSPVQDPRRPGQHIRNKQGETILPGSSLKGLVRSVVETLCNGCLTGYEGKPYPAPANFSPCQENTRLCISCRLFGMMPKQRRAAVFLGKVSAEDALVYKDTRAFYEPIYTSVLSAPKPLHQAFYLNQQGMIAGRKFYFHQDELRTIDRLLPVRTVGYRNQYIQPLKEGTWFSGRLNFRSLEADEFAALLLALTLEADMRHKIGYGKPLGLGSILIDVAEVFIVDYIQRYQGSRADSSRGITSYNLAEVQTLVAEQMASFDPQVHAFWKRFRSQQSLRDLHDIWEWPPDPTVEYSYPSKGWFERNKRARIADTRDLYPGEQRA
jgi:CRISPR/Cas system CSM-associated protein Csm3 (group 7 of RAMP superfamily)